MLEINEPPLPNYISQWLALIPLIVHLSSEKGDHNLVGELALAGKISLSVCPKIGHLQGIARLLSGIPDFLDRASSKSDLSSTVWDVDWGSTFPCANGAARHFLTRHALQQAKVVHDIEKHLPPVSSSDAAPDPARMDGKNSTRSAQTGIGSDHEAYVLRRYQTLHVIRIEEGTLAKVSLSERCGKVIVHYLKIPLLIALAALFIILNANGTAATVLVCAATQVACHFVPVRRPPGYLENTEKYECACMLSAIHTNASTWYLYVGERKSIDWLLNKTMITIDSETSTSWTRGFQTAHFLQLMAMTFVAAIAGWDGICLLCLLVVNKIFKFIWEYPAHWAALRWLSQSSLTIKAHSFKLTGRTPMLGAIQMLSASQRNQNGGFPHNHISWMDEILFPSERRQVWANELASIGNQGRRPLTQSETAVEDALSDSDRAWVMDNLKRTQQTFELMQKVLMEQQV